MNNSFNRFFLLVILILSTALVQARDGYWQHFVHYTMDIDFDVSKHQFKGQQKLILVNNSPDTLNQLFYHLYFNAFKPGSAMDVRSRNIPDPDPRVADRISKLKKSEYGNLNVDRLTLNGKPVSFTTQETILQVFTEGQLILPGDTVILEMAFNGQVPLQIRRSGRDNKEGIDYSMSQWYPKLCVYDEDGWHPNPYIGREFYGNWGDFNVNITIDKDYVVAGTGIAIDIDGKLLPDGKKKLWQFRAERVHDFMWAADRDYVRTSVTLTNGPIVYLYYQDNPAYAESWKSLPHYLNEMFRLASSGYGKYPYPVFYIIQGGDGGMEYPMGTLVTGKRSLASLVGVVSHELLHSWYQGVLGINESLYPWMDEGFTSYASDIITSKLLDPQGKNDPFTPSYNSYFSVVKQGIEEPLCTHADHYNTNTAYGMASYSKGFVYLHQLSYVVGQKVLDKALFEFFRDWSFKHPKPNDFLRIVEKSSGMVLDWYNEYWINSTHTIDYGIKEMNTRRGKYTVTLQRIGKVPMPLDVIVTYTDNTSECYNIPLVLMRGSKENDTKVESYTVLKAWQWPDTEYSFQFNMTKKIKKIEIDPSARMADVNKDNNVFIAE